MVTEVSVLRLWLDLFKEGDRQEGLRLLLVLILVTELEETHSGLSDLSCLITRLAPQDDLVLLLAQSKAAWLQDVVFHIFNSNSNLSWPGKKTRVAVWPF
jgi:hypothetical protein